MSPITETTMDHLLDLEPARPSRSAQVIVHPLFDEPEEKVDVNALGPMKLSRGARFALGTLRFYFIAVVLLAAYRVLTLSGLFGHR